MRLGSKKLVSYTWSFKIKQIFKYYFPLKLESFIMLPSSSSLKKETRNLYFKRLIYF